MIRKTSSNQPFARDGGYKTQRFSSFSVYVQNEDTYDSLAVKGVPWKAS